MQKSSRQTNYGNRNYWAKNRQNQKVKEAVSNDRNSPLTRFHPQKTIKAYKQFKSSSSYIGINTLMSPTHSVYERKIRQAIETRYKKSKISDYKYVKIQEKSHQKNLTQKQYSSNSRQSSQASQQMQEMRHFACLKNITFVNIHQFHSKKCAPIIKQTSKEKDKNRKRRFKIPLSFGRQNIDEKHSQNNTNQDEPKQQEIKKQQKSNVSNLNGKKPSQSKTFNCKEDQQINNISQEKQKKFLTSRLPYQRDFNDIKKSQFEKFSTLSPRTAQFSSQNQIKDTFKLKYPNKILNKNVENLQKPIKEQQKDQRSSSKTVTKTRRFLLHKNQKMQKIKTEPDQVSQLSHRFQSQNRDSSYQKIASLRKIQTQFIEPVSNQQQIYNKTAKNKAKMIKNYRNNNFLINRMNQNSQKSFQSASQQKWKLQEISFKFKPVNEYQKDSRSNQKQRIQENKNHALKLGLSLQKAYSKLLENKKKMQKRQDTSARTNYMSEQKKKRRMLRISPRNDKSFIINGQKESQLIKKDQQMNFCSAILIENRSQESLSDQRGPSKKYKFLNNNKGQRFSTIQ